MYELMLVSKVGKGDEVLALVEKNLKAASAVDLIADKLGKKPLAYTIKKQTEAEFTVLNFNVEGSAISDLTDILRLEQENLLRYLLTTQKRKKAQKKKFAAKKEEVVVKEEKAKAKVTVVTTKVVSEKSVATPIKSKLKDTKAKKEKKVVKAKGKEKKK